MGIALIVVAAVCIALVIAVWVLCAWLRAEARLLHASRRLEVTQEERYTLMLQVHQYQRATIRHLQFERNMLAAILAAKGSTVEPTDDADWWKRKGGE